MSRKSFHRLLERYLEGRCTQEEIKLVEHWYRQLDEHRGYAIDEANLEVVEEAIWNKIHLDIDQETTQGTKQLSIRYWFAVASVAALIIGAVTFVYLRLVCYPVAPAFAAVVASANEIKRVHNNTDSAMKIILPDQSLVELYPDARLAYPEQFSRQNREVWLAGDAFFVVAANKENPFWVFHEGMITKVLGTKFKIMAPRGEKKGEVIVFSGKVDVFYNVGRNGLVKRLLSPPEKVSLTTNHKVVLKENELEETIAENPLPEAARIAGMSHASFQDTPIPELAQTLGKLYALDIVADSSLAGITFTGDLSGIGLFKQLDMICAVTNTHYEVKGISIRLKRR